LVFSEQPQKKKKTKQPKNIVDTSSKTSKIDHNN
jgi:hypothetical protein